MSQEAISIVDVKDKITKIEKAKYGDEVRSSIVSSLRSIAEYFDQQVSALMTELQHAQDKATTAEANQLSYAALASQLQNNIDDLNGSINKINTAMERIRSFNFALTDYTKTKRGTDSEGNDIYSYSLTSENYPHITSSTKSDGTTEWTFHTPGVPQFTKIVVKRLAYDENQPQKFYDSVRYDLDSGTLYVYIADPLSKLKVQSIFIDNKADDKSNGEYTKPMIFKDTDGCPVLRIFVPRGPSGTGQGVLDYRAFVAEDIWTNDAFTVAVRDKITSQYFFGEEAVLTCDGRSDHKRVSGSNRIAEKGHCLRSTATPAYDAVLVTFIKSIPNTDAVNYKIAGTFNAGQTIDNNWDWSNRVTVIVPRGGQQIVTFVDAAGRIFTRTIYWLDEQVSRVCIGGKKDGWPTCILQKNSDYSQGTKVRTFPSSTTTGGLLISHARMIGTNGKVNGDLTEWAWASAGSYQNTKNTAKGFKNPEANININKAYDQFLIPVSVTGIIYRMVDTQRSAFGIEI